MIGGVHKLCLWKGSLRGKVHALHGEVQLRWGLGELRFRHVAYTHCNFVVKHLNNLHVYTFVYGNNNKS